MRNNTDGASLTKAHTGFSDSLTNVQHRPRGINWVGISKPFSSLSSCHGRQFVFSASNFSLKKQKKNNSRLPSCLLTIYQIWDDGKQKIRIRRRKKKRSGGYFVIKEFHGRMRVVLGGAQEAGMKLRKRVGMWRAGTETELHLGNFVSCVIYDRYFLSI